MRVNLAAHGIVVESTFANVGRVHSALQKKEYLMSGLKLVFHINENDRWPFTLRSARNFARSEQFEAATVVANGEAVRSFSKLESDPYRMARIRGLIDEGVKFAVCAIALKERQVNRDLIPDYVEVVDAGIVRISELQVDGYGYVKA